MPDKPVIYEYAGFRYEVPSFKPVEGQHPAAWKAKHIRAAQEMFEQDEALRIASRAG